MAAHASSFNVQLLVAIVEEKNLFNEQLTRFKELFIAGNFEMPNESVEGFKPSRNPLVNKGVPTQNLPVRLNGIMRAWAIKALEDEKVRKLLCLYSEVFGSVESPVAELLNKKHDDKLVSYYSSRLGTYLKFDATTPAAAKIQVEAIRTWYKGSMVERKKINGLVDIANKWCLEMQLIEGGMGPTQAKLVSVNLRSAVGDDSLKLASASESSEASDTETINVSKTLKRAEKGKVRPKTKEIRDALRKRAQLRRELAGVEKSLSKLKFGQPRRK